MSVQFDPAKSADPPQSSGHTAKADKTCPEALRVDIFSPSKTGKTSCSIPLVNSFNYAIIQSEMFRIIYFPFFKFFIPIST